MKEEFYLNINPNNCVKLPKRISDYLLKSNYLSEFNTLLDKEKVILNLGLIPKFLELKDLINLKVIQSGGISWDLVPTAGHNDRVLSSNAVYLALTKYYTQIEIDDKILRLYNSLIGGFRVDSVLSNTSTNPVLNKVIKNVLDLLSSEILDLKNQRHDNELLEEISNRLEELTNRINSWDNTKHIFLSESDYNALTSYEPNALYFIVDNYNKGTSVFGDSFPFILGGGSTPFHFGDNFPIILN